MVSVSQASLTHVTDSSLSSDISPMPLASSVTTGWGDTVAPTRALPIAC